jgi:isochorismate hydrolase
MANPSYTRSPELLAAASSRLVIVDMQEKFLQVMSGVDQLVANCRKLIRGAEILEVPISATVQYAKKLGPVTPRLADHLGECPDKLRFSCAEALDWAGSGTGPDARHQVVLAGIETHVCVLQTAFDLLAAGFEVFVPADAVLSRHLVDYEWGLRRMANAGVQIVTYEMVLFEWCEVAGSEQFKQLSQLVKGTA